MVASRRPDGRVAVSIAALLVVTTISAAQPQVRILVGAGDIAACNSGGDERTARLLDRFEGLVFTTGDNVYPDGTAADYADCFEPSWGRHRARIHPAPGNHDYDGGGDAYHDYFGPGVGPRGGAYYSYRVGSWHVIVLNSVLEGGAHRRQLEWLAAELEANPSRCRLAYWHHPLFSSGPHSTSEAAQDFWDLLYAHDTEIVLNGHDHIYERFGRQSPRGLADPAGIRQFIVGTGGGGDEHRIEAVERNSRVRQAGVEGVLRLELGSAGYAWEFIDVRDDGGFTDRGRGACFEREPTGAGASPGNAPAWQSRIED